MGSTYYWDPRSSRWPTQFSKSLNLIETEDSTRLLGLVSEISFMKHGYVSCNTCYLITSIFAMCLLSNLMLVLLMVTYLQGSGYPKRKSKWSEMVDARRRAQEPLIDIHKFQKEYLLSSIYHVLLDRFITDVMVLFNRNVFRPWVLQFCCRSAVVDFTLVQLLARNCLLVRHLKGCWKCRYVTG